MKTVHELRELRCRISRIRNVLTSDPQKHSFVRTGPTKYAEHSALFVRNDYGRATANLSAFEADQGSHRDVPELDL